jgi:hypothetical protein
MPGHLYYTGTLILYAVEITGAILITDLTTIFDIIGGISLSSIQFTLPGLFFLMALKKFGSSVH